MKNKKVFTEHMTLLGEIHNKKISKTIAETYFEILKSFPDDECISVFKKLIVTSKFFPKPAEFLEILEEKKGITCSSAWALVIHGLNTGIIPVNPTIQKAISVLGGWNNLMLQSYDELVWIEKRFNEYFRDITDNYQGLLEYHEPQKKLNQEFSHEK